jgi:hypothetical protein
MPAPGPSGERSFCDEAASGRNVIDNALSEGPVCVAADQKMHHKGRMNTKKRKNFGWRVMSVCVFVIFVIFVVKNLDAANTDRPIREARSPVVHSPSMVAAEDRQFTRLP